LDGLQNIEKMSVFGGKGIFDGKKDFWWRKGFFDGEKDF